MHEICTGRAITIIAHYPIVSQLLVRLRCGKSVESPKALSKVRPRHWLAAVPSVEHSLPRTTATSRRRSTPRLQIIYIYFNNKIHTRYTWRAAKCKCYKRQRDRRCVDNTRIHKTQCTRAIVVINREVRQLWTRARASGLRLSRESAKIRRANCARFYAKLRRDRVFDRLPRRTNMKWVEFARLMMCTLSETKVDIIANLRWLK